jgi:hypothetical protein
MAAVEAVKILTGYGRALRDEMLFFDLEQMDFRKLKIARKDSCSVCSNR